MISSSSYSFYLRSIIVILINVIEIYHRELLFKQKYMSIELLQVGIVMQINGGNMVLQ